MNNQPSEQSRSKAEKIKPRLLRLLETNSFEHLPIKSYKIQRMFNITDIVVRQAVGKLRDDGHPIASGKKGFWYARNAIELQSTIDNITDRIGAMSRRRQLLLNTQDRLIQEADGQLKLL
tara:strand:- start:726 stop:1085 length:360 start_codon:yes stop_codon:yes gene_type:complete